MATQAQEDHDGIKALRAKAKLADERAEQIEKLEGEINQLRRELTVTRSGLDAENKIVKLFLDNYKGEWEVDALLEAAAEYDLKPVAKGQDDSKDKEQPAKTAGDESPSADGLPEQGQFMDTVRARLENVFNAAQGAGPSERKAWMDAKTEDEFLALYDGPVVH